MTISIKKELDSSQTILLLMSGIEYNKTMVKVVKELSGKSVCYVTSNKTFDSLKETFKKNKVEFKDMVFIDSISKSLKKVPDSADQVYYVSNPGALTELSVVIGKFLRHDFDYLIFDSVTNLNIYNKTPVCIKFINSLVNKIKRSKTKAVFYAVGEKLDELPEHISSIMDRVL